MVGCTPRNSESSSLLTMDDIYMKIVCISLAPSPSFTLARTCRLIALANRFAIALLHNEVYAWL